jgi:hypothetical protein
MNEAANKVKQQIVEKIKGSTNILVTVSKDPTVDELSAALGLTVLLNKMEKHTTAIFSGVIPPAITFLDPDKVFENTADSLRDFIIALDKEKADHLRYKVDGDVVKIFITPYKTTITDQDLEFSQGDFNVELVLALGVQDQEHLDIALAANGQMLHDVTIATLSAGSKESQLGSMDWRDVDAGSLCEMVVDISDSLKVDKTLLDKQTATALLTGIVAATERFSNNLTSSRVMSMAAQLMAAGADQQLIAAKLQEVHEIDSLPRAAVDEIPVLEPAKDTPVEPDAEKSKELPSDIFSIPHNEDQTDSPVLSPTVEEMAGPAPFEPEMLPPQPDINDLPPPPPPPTVPIPQTLPEPSVLPPMPPVNPYSAPELSVTPPMPPVTPFSPAPSIISKPPSPFGPPLTEPAIVENKIIPDAVSQKLEEVGEPVFGGVLNATSDQAAEDARHEIDDQKNKTILSHSYLLGSDSSQAGLINSVGQTEGSQSVDIFADSPTTATPTYSQPAGLPLPPPLPDYSTLPPQQNSLPELNTPFPASAISSTIPQPTPTTNDPSQFQIPV